MKRLFLLFFVAFLLVVGNLKSQTPAGSLFVKSVPAGDGSGSSWSNAFDGRRLAWYLKNQNIAEGTVIYVAEGIYVPYSEEDNDPSNARSYTFNIRQDLEIRGGYPANAQGTDLSGYSPKKNITRLSGEIGNPGVSDNAYHVVVIEQNISLTLDGFYISDGYADVNSNNQGNGGGIFDKGGTDSQVVLSHLVVENNSAIFGGGLYINSNTASILREVFVQNNATLSNAQGGSGIFAWGNFLLENSTVNNNPGSAGIVSWRGDMLIRNSTISGNGTTGITADNSSFGDEIRLRVENSTIAANGSYGISIYSINTGTVSSIFFSSVNSLIVNNISTDFRIANGSKPLEYPVRNYSIIGDTKYIADDTETETIAFPVILDELKDNGGWGYTHALMDTCRNTAFKTGNPAMSGLLDQRGVIRNTPSNIGAFDGTYPVPAFTGTWTGMSNDWNDPGNWTWNASVSGILPDACTEVVIPGGLSFYPVLQSSTSPQAVCHTVSFQMGGEIARTDYLAYDTARVELAIGTNRWYTLAAPLSDMYSGDYFENNSVKRQDPITYMMKYNMVNPQTGILPTDEQQVGFSGTFNSLFEQLVPGMGYAVWAYDGEADDDTDPHPENIQYYHFPKDSLEYTLYTYEGVPAGKATIGSDGRDKKGRLGYEELNPNSSGDFFIDVVQSNESDTKALIGNPFMSHLNFSAFASVNNNLPGYYIWTGNSFDTFDFSDNEPIPPMQSFFIPKSSGPLSVHFNLNMSMVAGNELRSEQPGPAIKIEVIRDGQYQSNVKLKWDPEVTNAYHPEKDMWTLFSASETHPAVIYSLLDGKAASIRTLKNLSEPVELGIRTTLKGHLDFRISGMESLAPGYHVFLEDRLDGTIHNLNNASVFSFDNQTGNIRGRFFLRIENTNTGINQPLVADVRVFSDQGKLIVSSDSDDPVRSVKIFDLQGRILHKQEGLDTSYYSFNMKPTPTGQLVIVQVQTRQTQRTIKQWIER